MSISGVSPTVAHLHPVPTASTPPPAQPPQAAKPAAPPATRGDRDGDQDGSGGIDVRA